MLCAKALSAILVPDSTSEFTAFPLGEVRARAFAAAL